MAVDLLYLEDFDAELDPIFIKKELKPYFNGIFDDLALRSTPVTNKSAGKSIDKVTFVEYIQLPGIVSDRFYTLASEGKQDGRISEESFTKLMTTVFCSSLRAKMELTFNM